MMKKYSKYETFVNDLEEKIKDHPVLLNPLIKSVLVGIGQQKCLNILDPKLFDSNQDENLENFLKKDESQSSYAKKLSKSDSNQNNGKKMHPTKLYTRKHLKIVLNRSNKNETRTLPEILAPKLSEFCEWFHKSFGCNDYDLNADTILKMFLVNYDNVPMSVRLKTKPLDQLCLNESKKKTAKAAADESKHFSNQYGKWYLPKYLWRKDLDKLNSNNRGDEFKIESDKITEKILKSTGGQLFVQFYRDKTKLKLPYSFKNGAYL